jgi:hypothetical protein
MLSTTVRSISIVLLGTVAAACGGGGGGGGQAWQAVIDTVGDTVVVHTTSGGAWPDTAALVSEMRFGVFDGPDEFMFGSVSALAVSPDGEIYVTDTQVPAVRKYSAEGEYLYDLGREGGGPGEYKRPDGGLAVLPDGRVLVRDPGNNRINVYSAEGDDLTSWRLPGGLSTSRRLYVDLHGNAYAMVLSELASDVTQWKYGLAKYTPEGVHEDTLLAPTWDYDRPVVVGRREGSSSSTSVPFNANTSWTFSPLGYFVGGLSDDYHLDLYRLDEPRLRISKDWTPVSVIPDEAEEQERRIRENFTRQFPGWKWNGPGIPDTKPPYRDILVTDEGRIWVSVSQESRATMTVAEARAEEEVSGRPQMRFAAPDAFDVFEADGTFLGHVRVPEDFRSSPAPTVRGDYVWAVARDDLDVISIVRYKITLSSET